MQLKTQTDYAIRVLVYLADKKRSVAAKDISSDLSIAETYLPKIIRQLRKPGWVSSRVGTTGGYTLECDPKEITLWDIMMVMEDTVKINRCLEKDNYCSRDATATCRIHDLFCEFQKITENFFSSVTIWDVLNPKDETKN